MLTNSVILHRACFFLLLGLLFLTRTLVFLDVNISAIDSDQPFIWIAASDYAKGLFYEPRFYGQNYNTAMEGLFAVPFMRAGMPVYYAVPVATHLIFLFPFIFAASYLMLRKKDAQALLVLCMLLCMPAAFDMLTAIPRGFVTGLFFCSFFIVSLLQPQHLGYLALNTAFAVLGWYVNPNSLLVSVPFLFYMFLCNFQRRAYYLASFSGLLTAIPFYFLFDHFYHQHPDYVVYGLNYDFSWQHFIRNITYLYEAFAHISFFSDRVPLAMPLALFITAVALWRQRRQAFLALVACAAIIMLSQFSGKTGDGTEWVFYSRSRMLLGIPLLLAIFSVFLNLRLRVAFIACAIAIAFTAFKLTTLKKEIHYQAREVSWVGVHLMPLGELLNAMQVYQDQCSQHGSKHLVVANSFWLSTYLVYGGPAIFPDFPKTIETNSERRYYAREAATQEYPEKMILIASEPELDKAIDTAAFSLRRLDNYGLYLISNNRLSIAEFASLVQQQEMKLKGK